MKFSLTITSIIDILNMSKERRIFYVYQNGNLRREGLNRFSLDRRGLPFLLEESMNKKRKTELRIKRIEYERLNPWSKTLNTISSRCTTKSSKYYKKEITRHISTSELKELWFRDKAYLMKRPSIDRIDSKGDYIKSNCRYIELSENSGRENRKPCTQLTLDRKLIKVHKSQIEAEKQTGVSNGNISSCIKGNLKTAGGFKWLRVEEDW